jgi:hypothetical protein
MKRAFLIIVLAVTMFGVAAVAMARHHHQPHQALVSVDRSLIGMYVKWST